MTMIERIRGWLMKVGYIVTVFILGIIATAIIATVIYGIFQFWNLIAVMS